MVSLSLGISMKRPTNMRPNLSFIAAINSNLIPHNVNAFLDNFKELLSIYYTLENHNDIAMMCFTQWSVLPFHKKPRLVLHTYFP